MGKLEQFKQNKKYGFKNEFGEIILPAEYDYVPLEWNMKNNGVVIKNHKAGLVNQDGILLVDCIYDDILPLTPTLYAARKGSGNDWTFAIFDVSGRIIVDYGKYKFIKSEGDYLVCYKEACSKDSFHSRELYYYIFLNGSEWLDYNGNVIYSGHAEGCINDCIIIKKDDVFGFVNRQGKVIVPIYNEIAQGVKGQLCVKSCESGKEVWNIVSIDNGVTLLNEPFSDITNEGLYYECIKDNNYKNPIWINEKGVKVFEGTAELLEKTHLAVYNGVQWGVINSEGKKILNFSYDAISGLADGILILKNNKIGIVGWNGELIIEPSYSDIEFVNIHKGVYCDGFHKQHGKYNKDFIFDTDRECENVYEKLLRSRVYVKNNNIYTSNTDRINFNNPIILRNSDYQEVFTIEEGTLSSSRYDEVQHITNISFVVKRDGKFGVYRCDTKELVVECDYNRIQFIGNHTVLLEKDGLWGAKSLILPDHRLYSILKVEIPCKYTEIKYIDAFESFFSVKIEYKDYDDSTKTKYSIVTKSDKDLLDSSPIEDKLPNFESHFTEVGEQKFMSKFKEKYGFVHQLGYISLPFKYDELRRRNDRETFDARIGESWGVINLEGREIVAIKYKENLPESYAYTQVTDAFSGCKGILGEDGKELLPTTYSFIFSLYLSQNFFDEESNKVADYYIVGFGGYEDDDYSNFFSGGIRGGIWGVVNKKNEFLVKPKYECIKLVDGHFLCGRDGVFLYEEKGESEYAREYDGEYDVIDINGNFIFGGCSDFHYNAKSKLYFFKFGGQWKNECTYENEWNNFRIYSWVYYEANSRWLILDKELTSIIPKKDGSTYKFPSFFLGKITTKKNDKGQITHYWNMPLELFSIEYPEIKEGIIFFGEEGKRRAIRLSDKFISGEYRDIEFLDNKSYFYQYEDENTFYVSIGKYLPANDLGDRNLLPSINRYILITRPINGYCFAITQKNDICDAYLINIDDTFIEPIKAISGMERDDIFDAIAKGKLLIHMEEKQYALNHINVIEKELFDDDFASRISKLVSTKAETIDNETEYWYSRYSVETKEERARYASDYIDDEPYSWEDSMDDAFDGCPDAYWNID